MPPASNIATRDPAVAEQMSESLDSARNGCPVHRGFIADIHRRPATGLFAGRHPTLHDPSRA